MIRILATVLIFLAFSAVHAETFTPGNIVAVRVGDGSSVLSNSAFPVFLDEFTRAGVLVQSIPLPITMNGSNHPLTLSGTAISEGDLTRSVDGQYLILAGYDAVPGTAFVVTDSSNNRVIARVGSDGIPNTSTGTIGASAYNGNNIRSATSIDGSSFWMAGDGNNDIGGTYYIPFGSFTNSPVKISNSPNNTRTVNIFNNQLFVSASTNTFNGVAEVGIGAPTGTSNTTTLLPGFTAPSGFVIYDFWFFNMDDNVSGMDVLYFCDNRDVPPLGGLYKYSLVNGTWVSNGNIPINHSLKGLAAERTCFTEFYCSSGSRLYTITDTNGYNEAMTGVITEIVNNASNTKYRGIAFAPGTVVLTPLEANASATNATCFGANNGAINVVVNGGVEPYDYNWGGGISSQNRTNLSPGNYTVTVTDVNGCTTITSAAISQPSQLNVGISKTDVSCNGSGDGAITLNVSGGTPNYSYDWGSGITTQNRNNLSDGSYTVTVTDSKGCAETASATINQPTILSVSSSKTDVSCNGGNNGTISLNVSGGTAAYTYAWNGGATSQNRTNLSVGNYNVTVTDAKGCTATTGINISEPSALSTSISNAEVSCNGGNNGAITLSVSGGTAGYNYNWSNGKSTQNISGLTAGNFTVTITDNQNCTITDGSTITEPPVISISATKQAVSCNGGNDGTIDLTVSGGSPSYAYNWSNGATTQNITDLVASTYTVTVSDSNGCTISINESILQPDDIVTNINQINVSCNGMSNGSINLVVNGGTIPYFYNWSNGGDTTQNLNGLNTGTYNVTATDINGCVTTDGTTITQPTILSASLSKTNVSCNGGNNGAINLVMSGGTNPYTYNWSSGDTSQDLSSISAGNYNVTVTDNNGCSTSSGATISEPLALSTSVNNTNINCNGADDGVIDLSVSGGTSPYTYLWSTGAVSQDITDLVAGNYRVTITDFNVCTDSLSENIIEPALLEMSSSKVDVDCFEGNNGSIDLVITGGIPAYGYNWSSNDTGSNIVNLIAGNYDVTVTDGNNCTITGGETIQEPTEIAIISTTTDASCNGGIDGAIGLTISGGTPNYNILWSTGATSKDISNIVAGLYNVTVTDSNNCLKTVAIAVGEASALTINLLSITDLSCTGGNDGAIDISATGGLLPYVFNWSNGASVEDLVGLSAGSYIVTVTDSVNCNKIESYTVQPAPVVSLTLTKVDANCNGGTDGQINLNIAGGISPHIYNWSNGDTVQNIADLIANLYSVTVSDANGCTAAGAATVGEPPLLMLSVSNQDVTCFGGNDGRVDLTALGGVSPYDYNWSNGSTTKNLSGLSVGNYEVTVTDDKGCIILDEAIIGQPTNLVSSVMSEHLSCFGSNDGAINLLVSGGTLPYIYDWSNGSTAQNINGLNSGLYQVTVTDSVGCVTTDSANIIEPDILTVSSTVTNNNCFGENIGFINLNVSGGTFPYGYNWSNGDSSQVIDSLDAGNYAVTVTDANGCSITDGIIVTQPQGLNITSNITSALCSGDSSGSIDIMVFGGSPAYRYLWSTGDTTQDLSNLPQGTYNLTVSDNNLCTASFSGAVSQSSSLQLTTVINDITCFGLADGNINVSINGGAPNYNFIWSNDSTSQNLSGLSQGSYNLTVTDANGCVFIASSVIDEPSEINLTFDVMDISCYGAADGEIDMDVSGGLFPYTYNWSNGSSLDNLTGLSPGNYMVTTADSNSCTNISDVDIIEPDSISIIATINNTSSFGGNDGSISLDVEGGAFPYTYLWSDSSELENLDNLTAGSYCVTVTDENLCTLNRCFTVKQPPLSIEDKNILEGFVLFISRGNLIVRFQLNQKLKSEMIVFDLFGRVVVKHDFGKVINGQVELPFAQHAAGTYIVNIITERGSISKKILFFR